MNSGRREAWNAVVAHLEAHHGVIDRLSLARLGVTDGQLGTWVADRRLERVAPRAWRLVGMPTTWQQRLAMGLASLGTRSWVSHSAAAQLHGFDRTPRDRVEFLVLRPARTCRLGEDVHSTRRWGPVDAVIVDGLRATSATRTVIDLANVRTHPDRLKAAIDSAVRLQLSSPETIVRRLAAIRSRGRVGVRLLDELLVDAGGHTMLEREFLRLMREAGLPRPETQVVFADGRRTIARVDFLYREWGIVVEVTGRIGHSTPQERARDAQRRNELLDLALRVYEYTWEDVVDTPYRVQREMRERLRAAGWSG
jgi:hypothetical protein